MIIFCKGLRGSASDCHKAKVQILVGSTYMGIAEHGLESFNLDEENDETLLWPEDTGSRNMPGRNW